MFNRLTAYLRGLCLRHEADAEAGEELQFHLDHEIEANLARGMSSSDAKRVALRDLGGLTQTRESIRAVRTIGLDDLARDVRYGARALLGSPRFTIVALLTIALMVGGITTIFTLVHAVLLRPLPYPRAGRLAIVESRQPNRFGTTLTLADALTFKKQSRSFDLWGLYKVGYVENVPDANNEPMSVQDMRVTPDLFPMLGIDAAIGRGLLPSDADPGAPDVAVISFDFWQTLFGGRDDVVGKTVRLRWGAFTVVGVTRQGADVPTNWLSFPIIWRPVRDGGDLTDPELTFTTLARLRPDATIERARAELTALADGLAAEDPGTHKGRAATVTFLRDAIVGDFKRVLWIFFSAVSCVLLIGIGNLVSLQLARNGAREREITLRAALGASRWRLMRQLVVESVLVCSVGGAFGFAVAWPAVQLIAAGLPQRLTRVDQIAVDIKVALFACGVSLVVGVIVGAVPAWQASRVELTRRLNAGGRTVTLGAARGRMQRTLIAFQTAVALILLIGAGLLANSFYRLISRDAGMREEGLWAVAATLPSRYRDEAAQNAFWTSALERVRAARGVESAAVGVNTSGPLSGNDISTTAVPEGVTPSPRGGLRVSYRRVGDGYFNTLGIPLLKGRPILASDVAGAESIVVINELVAAALWPGQDPIGRRLRSHGELETVVGVIPTFRHTQLDGEFAPQIYTPYLQQPSIASSSVIMFRASPGNDEVAGGVRSVLTGLEKDLHVTVSTMAGVRWKLVAAERFRVAVILLFAGSALTLALVGIFGLVAYTVGQRQREIAVRVALGAARRDILHVASRQAIAPALAGLVLGVLGASVATRLLASFLVDIQPLDLPTFAAALGAFALAAVVAGIAPAWQALTIDPVEALRSE